eukprot:g224.t1
MDAMTLDDKLSMSLGDIVGSRGRGSGGGGPVRRQRGRRTRRSTPYSSTGGSRASSSGSGGAKSNRVFVGNLSWETTWQQLKDHFKKVGGVAHAEVLTRNDGKSSGAGVVEFASDRDAKRAINTMHDTELDGRMILVREDRKSGDGKTKATSKRVFVGNLSWDTTWQQLKDLMRKCGNVVHAEVLTRRDGKSSGAGVVEFASVRDAQRAIDEMTDIDLGGRPIFVREDREDTSGSGRSGGGGGGGGGSGKSNRVFVGNLSWDTTWQRLKDHMRKCGNVVHAEVLTRRDGKSSGGGVVEFASARDARRAIDEMHDTDLDGRMIFVREDREDAAPSAIGVSASGGRSGGRSGGSGGDKSSRVFVGNLSWDTTWQRLKDHMRKCGNVVHAEVLTRRDGKSSGGGVVEFASARDARRAIDEMHDTDLDGRMIFVREDREN